MKFLEDQTYSHVVQWKIRDLGLRLSLGLRRRSFVLTYYVMDQLVCLFRILVCLRHYYKHFTELSHLPGITKVLSSGREYLNLSVSLKLTFPQIYP